MTYTWLLFDADGTLFDYDQAEATALEQAFAEFGTAFEPALLNAYREINTRVWREFEAGRITAERLRLQRFELLFETLGRSLAPAEFSPVYLRHLARASHLIDGAREIVPALCAKYRLALITNGLRDGGDRRRQARPGHLRCRLRAAGAPAARRGAAGRRQPHVRHRWWPTLWPGHLLVQPDRRRASGRRDVDL
jgi:FMN phosphatase YigB (HAD superfamily)